MKQRILIVLTLVLGLMWPLASTAGGPAIVVIVNKANPVSKLSRSELRPMMQTTRTSWDNGDKVLALNLPASNPIRKGMDAAVLGLDPDRVAQFWIDRKIRGGARPPKKIPSASMMLKVVAKKKGALGYVAESDVNDTVKVVAKIVGGVIK